MALSRRNGQRFQSAIWPGFVDAMTGLLLVLMFVLTIFMIVQFVLRETITGQADRLDTLSAEVAALSRALGLEQDKSASLSDRVGVLTSTLSDANQRAEAQSALIASLQGERDSQAAALAAAATRIASFEEQVAGLLADREGNLGTIAALEGQRDTLLSEQEQLRLALAGLREEIDVQSEQARLAAAKREALEALIADLNQQNTEAAEAQTALFAQVGALENRLSEEEAARLAEAAAAEALRARLENATTELTAMTLALEEERRRAEETLTMLAAAETAREDLDVALAAALLATQTRQDQIIALQGQLSGMGSELAVLEGVKQSEDALRDQLQLARDAIAERDIAIEALRASLSQVETALDTTLSDQDAERAALQAEIAALRDQLLVGSDAIAERDAAIEALRASLSQTETTLNTTLSDQDAERAALQVEISALRAQLTTRESELASTRTRLAAALAQAEDLNLSADDVRKALAAALAAKLAAEQEAATRLSEAEERAALLAQARAALADQEGANVAALREQELLNQQVAALREQLGALQALLDDSKIREAVANVQMQTLGSDLNAALARVAAEEKRRRELEEEKTALLEAEKQNLEKYRSEFFGRLRDVLGAQEGVRIEGDRFVFSSEVLFAPGQATLSQAGQAEIAKVAAILRNVADEIPGEIDWVIRVDGHTDDVPIRNSPDFADNWELSQARALSVVRYMIDFLGIPPDRLAANGFGQYQPINTENSREARAQNRRIELKFTEK